MHSGHSEKLVASMDTIAKCLLIIVESLPKLSKDAKESLADMKESTAAADSANAAATDADAA